MGMTPCGSAPVVAGDKDEAYYAKMIVNPYCNHKWEDVLYALNKGANPQADCYDNSVLCCVCQLLAQGSDKNSELVVDVAVELLEHGVDQKPGALLSMFIEYECQYGCASQNEQKNASILRFVKELLKRGVKLNGEGDGQVPLLRALDRGLFEVASLLVDSGANLKGTLQMLCCHYKRSETTLKLLQKMIGKGTDVNEVTADSQLTPLLHLLSYGEMNEYTVAMFNELIAAGADVHYEAQASDEAHDFNYAYGHAQRPRLSRINAMDLLCKELTCGCDISKYTYEMMAVLIAKGVRPHGDITDKDGNKLSAMDRVMAFLDDEDFSGDFAIPNDDIIQSFAEMGITAHGNYREKLQRARDKFTRVVADLQALEDALDKTRQES